MFNAALFLNFIKCEALTTETEFVTKGIYNMADIEHILTDDTYKALIEYLVDRCDAFSLVIPDYTFMEGEPCPPEDYAAYSDYVHRTKQMVKTLTNRIILFGRSEKYFDQERNYPNHYYVFKLDRGRDILEFLLQPGGIFHWIYPNYPEDICFYSNKKRIVHTVAHEKMFFIKPENEQDRKLIDRLQLANWVDKSKCDFYLKL